MKNCSTCANYITRKPHTCDICESLDNDEDYTMWEKDKADYKKLYLKMIGTLNTVSEYDKVGKVEYFYGDNARNVEIKRSGYRDALDDIKFDMIHLIYLSNLEKIEDDV